MLEELTSSLITDSELMSHDYTLSWGEYIIHLLT